MNFKYDYENLSPAARALGRGQCGHSLFFVLEGKETNKSFKDTMSLNSIDNRVERFQHFCRVLQCSGSDSKYLYPNRQNPKYF
jgi:hypothetical protein